MNNGFLRVQEVADYLNMKPATIYAKAEMGEIPYYKVGRLIRFKRSEIEEWMKGLRQGPCDANKRAVSIMGTVNGKAVDQLVKKSIEKVSAKRYIPDHGKPNQAFKDLGGEV